MSSSSPSSSTPTEPPLLRWPLHFGGLVEAVHGADIDPSGRTDLLRVLDRAKKEGVIRAEAEEALLECDCNALRVSSSSPLSPDHNDLLAVVPLHHLASVGFVREQSLNILALKVGDMEGQAPDLFDLIVFFTQTKEMAEQICQHLAQCFQFVYREALSGLEEEGREGTEEDQGQGPDRLAAKFCPPVRASCSSASSLCSVSSPSPHHLLSSSRQLSPNQTTNGVVAGSVAGGRQRHLPDTAPPVQPAHSTSASSNSTKQAVELINEYLTMLSASLSHDELNKFAILMRRWRACEMPILEFAQKLLELYGPERRHLLARMRTLLRGDPSELEALADFLRANGVVENAAATGSSALLTAEMSLGEPTTSDSRGTNDGGSCPPSAPLPSASPSVVPPMSTDHDHPRPSSSSSSS